jgi:hypothetical protein
MFNFWLSVSVTAVNDHISNSSVSHRRFVSGGVSNMYLLEVFRSIFFQFFCRPQLFSCTFVSLKDKRLTLSSLSFINNIYEKTTVTFSYRNTSKEQSFSYCTPGVPCCLLNSMKLILIYVYVLYIFLFFSLFGWASRINPSEGPCRNGI